MDDFSLLKHQCEVVEAAIHKVKGKLSRGFIAFPKGACEFASNLFAEYLKCFGIVDIRVVKGSYKKQNSPVLFHIWLEYNELLIDITADQFSKSPRKVSLDKKWWYTTFNYNGTPEKFNESGFEYYRKHCSELDLDTAKKDLKILKLFLNE